MRRPAHDLSDPSRNIEESVGSPSSDTADPVVDISLPSPAEEIEAKDGYEDDETPSIPPPHIAARLFYPPMNQTRRKDSAASSRRNSISSLHSRSSHGGGLQDGPQSKYIAQHLRRASILEDRKARLADRAAHAEKVRLRAAVAKAASKDTSLSEERALAAAQARERNLAEIAATCAEEVKRAKAVAETMKEKRLQEITKMKTQMQERLAEAEKRREELRKANSAKVRGRERGHSSAARKPTLVEVLPEVRESKEREKSPLRPDTAALKIQAWWRSARRRHAVAEFTALGLSIDCVSATSFEKVADLLSEEKVLLTTARVLRICGLQEGDSGSVDEMAAVRSFLSAFLILGHPAQVLSNKEGKGSQEQVGAAMVHPIPKDDLANPQSQELVGKAKDLLIAFEQILSRLTSQNNYTPPPSLLQSFPEVYAAFYNAFIAWKARDSSSLIELMIMQFVELDAIWQTVKDSTDGSVDEVYKKSIQDNQVLLLVRIKKLAGPTQAKKLISEAVRQSRKAKAKRLTGDTKPRIAEHTTETAMGDINHGDQENAGPMQIPTPPATPARSTGPARTHVPSLLGIKGLLPDNRVVVHELAINKEFRIEPYEYREGQEHFLAPLFEEMRSTLQSGDDERHFLLLLRSAEFMREKLQRLVKPGNQMHSFIEELLNTDIAKRQFMAGSFSYEKFFQAMGSLLPKLCAPVRDEEVKELIEEKLSQGNYVDRIEALMGFIDVMLSDYANYLLQLAAPQIVSSATTYETKMFESAMESGAYDLSRATAAWREARLKVHTEVARRDPEGINHPRSRPTMNRIYSQMLVDVFTDLAPGSDARLPEMLSLDAKRALAARQMTRQIVTVGAILLQCKNLLKRDVRAPWRQEAQRVLLVLQKAESQPETPQESTVDGILAALESGRSMPTATKFQLRSLVTKFVAAALEPEFRDPVLRLLLNRLRAHILSRLAAASASEKVKAATTAGERLASLGLAEFADKVRDIVETLGQVGQVDRDAHGVWWDQVAELCEKEAQDQIAG